MTFSNIYRFIRISNTLLGKNTQSTNICTNKKTNNKKGLLSTENVASLFLNTCYYNIKLMHKFNNNILIEL